jgi:hypothetical protein
MRKLVLTIVALLALFSALRAYTQAVPAPVAGVKLHPGLVEIGDGAARLGIAFGLLTRPADRSGSWNLLPIQLTYTSGDKSVAIGLNGLTFLLRGGASVGKPVKVDAPRSGDVISIGGRVSVDARVDGDVWALGAGVDLGPRAEVTGNVVAIGGVVSAAAKSVVHGSVSQIAQLKIPFIGMLGTEMSAQVMGFARQGLAFLLLGFALFLSAFYRETHTRGLYQSLPSGWRSSLITLALSLVLVPLLTVLLVASVIGVFFLPFLAMALVLLGLDGFLALCTRLGGWLRLGGADAAAGGPKSLFLFTSGLLGLFLVKSPALVGILLTLVRSKAAAAAGDVLQLVSLGLLAAGLLYGFSSSLAYARSRGER